MTYLTKWPIIQLFLTICILIINSSQSSVSLKLNDRFTSDSDDIQFSNVNIYGNYKIVFDFNCHLANNIECERYIDNYSFFAEMVYSKEKILLKISHFGECWGNKIVKRDNFNIKRLKLEFPYDHLPPNSNKFRSFYDVNKITYEKLTLPNETPLDEELGDSPIFTLILSPDTRMLILTLDNARNTALQCLREPPRPVLATFDSCDKFSGQIELINKNTLFFRNFRVRPEIDEEISGRSIYKNNVNFKMVLDENMFFKEYGEKVNSQYINNHLGNILVLKEKILSEEVNIPLETNLDHLYSIEVNVLDQLDCTVVINPDIKRESAKIVDVINFKPKCLLAFEENAALRQNICRCYTPPVDSQFSLSNGYALGSVVTLTCTTGTRLYPPNFSATCQKVKAVAEWVGPESPVCFSNVFSCEEMACQNDSECVMREGVAFCECFNENYSGVYCENANRPCDKLPCVNGFCEDAPHLTDYSCTCNDDTFTGKDCESPPEITSKCGKYSTGVKIEENGDFKCQCTNNRKSLLNGPCQLFDDGLRCFLPRIIGGSFKTTAESIAQGQSVGVECAPKYRNVRETVTCLGTHLDYDPDSNLCIESALSPTEEEIFIKKQRETFPSYAIVIILIFTVLIITLIIGCVLYRRRVSLRNNRQNRNGFESL